jgi:3',5'-cyclic-AMP phosphodiesterase
MLTVAHITDLHITSAKDPVNHARHERRLRQVLDAIHALKPRPVAIVATGDLVHNGEAEEYAELRRIFANVQIPILVGVGNHDRRNAFRAAFPDTPVDGNGFVQYATEIGGLRLVMADSLEEGKNPGAYCEARAVWLQRVLDEAPDVPTIVAIHHPPVRSGIQWMEDPSPNDDWVLRIAEALRDRRQVVGVIAGHLHRAFHAAFAGHIVSVSAATGIELTLDLTEIDRSRPDGRQLLNEEPPGFSVLLWDKEQLTTHVCVAGEFPGAVRFNTPFGAH